MPSLTIHVYIDSLKIDSLSNTKHFSTYIDNMADIPTPALATQCDTERLIRLAKSPEMIAPSNGAKTIVR